MSLTKICGLKSLWLSQYGLVFCSKLLVIQIFISRVFFLQYDVLAKKKLFKPQDSYYFFTACNRIFVFDVI